MGLTLYLKPEKATAYRLKAVEIVLFKKFTKPFMTMPFHKHFCFTDCLCVKKHCPYSSRVLQFGVSVREPHTRELNC